LPDWDDGGPTLQTVVDAAVRQGDQGDHELAYLMFTSGSTGRPRAAAIRAAAALRVGRTVAERLELTPEDRVLNISPLYHCAGLVAVLLAAHSSGAEVSIFEGYQHEAMLGHLWRTKSSVLVGFDVVTMRLIRGCVERHGEVPVRKMLSGPGRPIFDEVSALGIDLAIMYGLTEASNVVSLTQRDDTTVGRRDTNGFPLPGVDVKIVDHETGEELPRGEAAEITYRGWNLMAGYYARGGGIELALNADGYFHTGDYGYQDDEGRVCYRGRYAGMIKTGGENVSELEVESFLATEFPWLRGVSVVGVPDEQWGEIVVAVVDVPDEHEQTVNELRDRCRGRIAGYKIPKAFLPLPTAAWPVSDTGKVLKRQLAAIAQEQLCR
jgi:acyl-CoA synthetase (AMP-forming)/AMP-acid ligase II